jgi:hypothetical protein
MTVDGDDLESRDRKHEKTEKRANCGWRGKRSEEKKKEEKKRKEKKRNGKMQSGSDAVFHPET